MGVLDNLPEILGVETKDLYYISTLPHYLRKNKKIKQKYSSAAITTLLAKIENYSLIPDDIINDELFVSLSEFDGIDSGEQVLFSVNPPSREFLILTGDKNAILALNNSCLSALKSKLKDKIIFLEELLLKLLPDLNVDEFYNRLKSLNFCGDMALKICLGQTHITTKKIEECLVSYIRNLRSAAPSLFTESQEK